MSLRIVNQSTGAVLVAEGRVAGTRLTRLVGLMGRRELPEGEGLLITPCNSIHTSFMRFPIDVLYVNKEDRVVDLEEAMRPWRARLPRRRAKYVVELPAGTIARSGTAVGHQLMVEV